MSAPASADIVVIGIGTAGAVLASRLVSASISVVALEAGADPGPSGTPAWPADLIDADHVGTSHDWGYSSPAGAAGCWRFPAHG